MAAVYNWSIESIDARKVFTDKHGNIRQNVIKTVILAYTGKEGDREEKERTIVNFSIVDLSVFKPVDEVTNQEVLQWALNKLHPKEKVRMEKFVQSKFEDLGDPENIINIVIND
jgi:hypothetical protein